KSALEWLMERYAVTTDKASGIVNDPNLWDTSNPGYIVELIQSLVTVSVHTVRIVAGLPKWD
ncbi:MAG: helicase, partial [Planctomycetia bacterium]|nr:helicase [Planctomycetia bacterium]